MKKIDYAVIAAKLEEMNIQDDRNFSSSDMFDFAYRILLADRRGSLKRHRKIKGLSPKKYIERELTEEVGDDASNYLVKWEKVEKALRDKQETKYLPI